MHRQLVLLAVLGAALAACSKEPDPVTYIEQPTVTAEPAPTAKY
ncbi:hypothetical protein V8J36_12555 [Frigidibacter sp. MR17.14]